MPASCPCPCPPRRSGAASAPEPARLPGPSAAVRVEIRTPDGSSKARLRARRNCREKRPVSTRWSYRKTRAERWRARSLYNSCKAHVGTDALLMCGRGGFCRGWICDPDQPCNRELESGTAQAGTAALGRPASPKGWRDLQEAERPDLSRLKTQYARATGLHAASSGQALADRQTQPPLLAIVGRPNVGKSTLFNRLVGSRRAIVGDEPGITRDRLYGEAEWRGRRLRIVDTGGILPEDKDFIPAEIFRQAKVALKEADAVVMVVDGRTEMAAPDIDLALQLIRTGKPLFLLINTATTEKQQGLTDDFHRLGIRRLFPISAENARGLDDLLDAVLEILPPANQMTTGDGGATEEEEPEAPEPHETKVA